MHLLWLIAVTLCFKSVWADPLDRALDMGTSLSQSYEARNVFLNPAALGFESALNGAQAHSSFALGSHLTGNNDLALALAIGAFGAGAERIASSQLSRYRLALGAPLTPRLFAGARFSAHRFDSGVVRDTWDFGLQFKPGRFFGLGAVISAVGRPEMQLALGATVRPLNRLDLTFDLSIPTETLPGNARYQAMLGWEAFSGLRLRAGYHSQYQWIAGLQLHFGNASVFGSVQPDSSVRRFVVGAQSSTTPYRTAMAPAKTIKTSIARNLGEERSSGGLLSPYRPSLLGWLQSMEELQEDPSVKTVLIQLDEFPLGLAAAHEVHASIGRLRKAGKTVEVFLGNAGLKEYLVASAADRIAIDPAGEIRWLGLRQSRYFLKGTLDKAGVEGEFLAAGKYKSAPEMFTRRESSDTARQAAEEELSELGTSLFGIVDATKRTDKVKRKRLETLGILGARDALKEGLVDGLDSFASAVARREKTEWVTAPYRRRSDALALPHRVAVIVASGNILPDSAGIWGLMGGRQVTPSGIEKKIRMAQKDSQTRAVLLRVSSPGGEVLASERIATRLQDSLTLKPLVVSMADVAASGGYYIATPGKALFAGPLSVTGSIGVFLGKFNLSGLYSKLDLKKEILTTGLYPGLLTEDRPWTQPERAVMQRRLRQYYEGFVAHVAKHRSLPGEQAELAAQGRVWTGTQALQRKLVDQLGGYFEAIQYAASEAGLGKGEYEVWEVETGSGLFDLLQEPGAMAAWIHGPAPALPKWIPAQVAAQLELAIALENTPFLYLAPSGPPQT